ncbi:hypothetical protein FRC04_008888 [Tulasnella sp. 424]|nr:hypothetical protein FRC04_008888 [Tulasnella sp. 424]KAG8973788.1 hypothetical protein FRC05_008207 [Tulasnella sp. 425]
MTVTIPLTQNQVEEINSHLRELSPQDILQWAVDHVPSLYQTTAFGLTGLAATDMLAKLTPSPPPLIFLDTLHHFQETIDLKNEVERRYGHPVHVFRPMGTETAEDFTRTFGERLWENNEVAYDYLVKVEPAQRAYRTLGVKAVITGRRASQGGDRSKLQPLDVDDTGMIKINPFWSWKFSDVKAYIDTNNVPTNALLTQGYKSIGDWHSTVKSGEGDAGERAGRWAGKAKTECGLHTSYFDMKRKLKEQQEAARREEEERSVESPVQLATAVEV